MTILISAFMILLMYFLAGINKARNFAGTVNGFKNMFFLKKLPMIFYQLAIFLVIVLEILAPIIILYSLQTNMYNYLAYCSSVGLAIFTVLATLIYHFPPVGGEYYAFMKNLTATGSLMLLSTLF
tara:strand:- start:806 stop:1180 length:375 start_codon:yes stop_codon:yes gene_type:complete